MSSKNEGDRIVEQEMKDRHVRAMASLIVRASLAALIIVFVTIGWCCHVSATKDSAERDRLKQEVESLRAENRTLRIVEETQ